MDKTFFAAKIWVNWKWEIRKGKRTKVPYQPSGAPASSTDSVTWSTHEECKNALSKFDGIGFVFGELSGIIGIDLDHCIADGKNTNAHFEKIISYSKTYSEYSPSKTGLHILFRVTEPIELEANKHKFDASSSVEVYSAGRYFTFTGDKSVYSKPLRTISAVDFIDLLKTTLGYPWKKKEETHEEKLPLPSLSDDEILSKMFAAKNGDTVKRLYDGDISSYNNDYSSADFALCLHLSFWTRKDAAAIERLWLSSPLGKRAKTKTRKDYRDRTIANAIASTTDIYSPTNGHADTGDVDYDFIENKNGPRLIFPNILRVLRKHPSCTGKFRKNDFSHMVETCYGESSWITLNDSVISRAREHIAEWFSAFSGISFEMTKDAIIRVAEDNKINPPKDFLTSLAWDKKPRLNSWLHNAYGVPDDEVHQAMGANWLKGLVKRVMRPGCQFDEVLALESPQGWRKSTSIRVLGAPWHVETAHSIDNKDFYLLLAQNVLVEFSEGEIFDRASVKKLKAEITKTEDQVRPPYERGMVKFPRSCVFAVTTNKLELKDDTGNRRWLPVSLEHPANIDWISENKEQLYAEAYYRVIVLGETTHEYPQSMLEDLQASRSEKTDEDEVIVKWYATLSPSVRAEGVKLADVADILYPHTKITNLENAIASSILRRSLHLERTTKRVDGVVVRRWIPTERTNEVLKNIQITWDF